jgi:nucleotide-binding universal stress UspA family protein
MFKRVLFALDGSAASRRATGQAFRADLIVLGHQRYNSWIERWWRGTTEEAVNERAHCNVFISIHD